MAVQFRTVQTHETAWTALDLRVVLNCRLDARLVPSASSPEGVRLVVLHLH